MRYHTQPATMSQTYLLRPIANAGIYFCCRLKPYATMVLYQNHQLQIDSASAEYLAAVSTQPCPTQ
jgi:hypothetical protein